MGVDYSVPTYTSEARPVRDGLASFQATRVGIKFTPSPKLSQAPRATICTVEMDTDGQSTKPCHDIVCAPPQEAVVYGVVPCMQLGNFQQRYNPEFVKAWLDLTAAAAACTAELALLTAINTGSLALTATGNGLGAARSILPVLDQAAAGMRYRNRTVRETPTIRTIMPDFVKDLLRADIAMELAHDNDTPQTDALALAEQRIATWFSERNIVPIWSLEATTGPPSVNQAAGALGHGRPT